MSRPDIILTEPTDTSAGIHASTFALLMILCHRKFNIATSTIVADGARPSETIRNEFNDSGNTSGFHSNISTSQSE
ncbi:MAG: hypothetical protein LUQ27_01050 [Methanomassiliicoccales archaeon]|nr:hypothetical protein [Methanomassiliicoccales archaeon]